MTAPLPTLRRAKVRITAHAADRYRERAKPHLTRRQALAELERLAELGDLLPHPPAWCGHLDGDAFLQAGDVVLVLRRGRAWSACTCLVRGTPSERDLERRRAWKRERERRKGAHRAATESYTRTRRLRIAGRDQ